MMSRPPILAALLAFAQVFAALGSTAATLIFARLMGAEAFGQAMLMIALAGLASLAVSLNVEGGAMRFMLQGPRADRAGFRDASRWVVLGLGGILGTGLGTVALTLGHSAFEALALAALPMLIALCRVTARLGASLGAIRAATLPRLLSRPLVLGVAAAFFWVSGAVPTPTGLIALVLFAAALAIAIQGCLLNRRFRHMGPGDGFRRDWLRTGLLLVPSLLFLELYRDLVLVSAAPGLDDTSTGALAAALSLIALPGFALIASEVVFSPRISRAVAEADPIARDRWLRMAAATRFAGTLGFSAALLLLMRPVASFLGEDFDAATRMVPVLLLIPIARMIAGNPVLVMTLTGHSRDVMVICGTGAVAIAPTILAAGANGSTLAVALAASAGYATVQAVLSLRCLSVTGIDATGLMRRTQPLTA